MPVAPMLATRAESGFAAQLGHYVQTYLFSTAGLLRVNPSAWMTPAVTANGQRCDRSLRMSSRQCGLTDEGRHSVLTAATIAAAKGGLYDGMDRFLSRHQCRWQQSAAD